MYRSHLHTHEGEYGGMEPAALTLSEALPSLSLTQIPFLLENYPSGFMVLPPVVCFTV